MDPELDEDKDTGEAQEPSLEDQLSDAIGLTEDAPEDAPLADEAAPSADGEPAAVEEGQAAPAAGDKPAKAAEAKGPAETELYAPLPETNPRKTHERFARLVEGHKQVSQERDSIAQDREQLKARVSEYEQGLEPLRQMGFNTQEAVADLQQFSAYRNALATGNMDTAISIWQEQGRQLSLAAGRRIDVNPLDRFQDLDQRHQAGELDEATALELARSRHVQGLQHQQVQQRHQLEQQNHQAAETVHAAARNVDQVVVGLMKDPDYSRVEPELLKQLPAIKDNYPPHMWAQEVQRAYATESRFLRLQAQQQQRTPQPLRGNGHAGGQPAPTTMAEAVLQSMGLS